MVDYDPLPAVLSVEEALEDEVLLFPDLGSNVANRGGSKEHDDGLFDGCDVVVSDVLLSQRLAAAPLEPRSAAAVVGDDGRLTLWATSQTPHTEQDGRRGPARARPGAGARRQPGRGRRVRREDDRARRSARRVARAQAGTARAVDRDAHREHGRAPAGPRATALVHARRDAGRASCSRTGSRFSATPAPTRPSAPTSRTSPP